MLGEWELKNQIIEIGKRLWSRGFVAANDGNISIKINEDEYLTTPTGVSKGFMSSEMIVKINQRGQPISRKNKYKPSTEIKMHLEVYKERADVQAVVHAHPPYCTSFAVAGVALDKCVLPEAILTLGAVPIAKFGLPSTEEIPMAIREHVQKSDAILLANHGALTLGKDLISAYHKMETLEHTAQIIWLAFHLGQINVLPAQQAERIMELREKYNLSGKIVACDPTPIEKIPKKKEMIENKTEKVENKTELSEQAIEKIKEQINQQLSRFNTSD